MTIPPPDCNNLAHRYLSEGSKVYARSADELSEIVTHCGNTILDALRRGNKVLIFGNGGSAADAQHFSSELTGRFLKHRKALPAIALSTDTSALTAISNDYGFEVVFARQIEALALPGDVAIGITTSGASKNILRGLDEAKKRGCTTIGLTGNLRGEMESLCHFLIKVPSPATSHIQEIHTAIIHIWGTMADQEYAQD